MKETKYYSEVYRNDCLKQMKTFPDKSIDMILCDLPYGVTKNEWDSPIPLEELWSEYKRIIKDNGAIVLFADGLFMAKLMLSEPKLWRYNLVWDKVLPSGFLNANKMPLRRTEQICVFYKKLPTYNPQKTKGKPNHSKGKNIGTKVADSSIANNNYGDFVMVDNHEVLGDMKHPTSLLRFPKTHPSKAEHSTEKPVALLEWLIKTYTNEGDTVLDNCMGSGSTGVACVNTNRKFVGIEIEQKTYETAIKRIGKAVDLKLK